MWRISMKTLFTALIVVCLLGVLAYGQADGISRFGAADVHDVDVINLATLTPVMNIPVISKQGAIPFSLTMTAGQLCSIPAVGSALSCTTSDRFGNFVPGLLGSLLRYSNVIQVTCNGTLAQAYSGWKLYTADGLNGHPIDPNIYLGGCTSTFSQQTVDGSGYYIQTSGNIMALDENL
jgi:hypothetical protein